eukprot:4955118-Prymnesium_polylepis.1
MFASSGSMANLKALNIGGSPGNTTLLGKKHAGHIEYAAACNVCQRRGDAALAIFSLATVQVKQLRRQQRILFRTARIFGI